MSATIEDLTELAELLYRADGYEERRAAWEALRNAIDDVKAVCAGVADMVDRGIAEIDSLRRRFAGSVVVQMLPTSEEGERMADELMAAARQEASASRVLTPTEQKLQTAALDAMAERDQMSEMLGTSQIDRANLADQVDQLQAEVERLRKTLRNEQEIHDQQMVAVLDDIAAGDGVLELAPQPPPANPPRGAPVWPMAIESAKSWASPRLVNLMHARDQQGRAKYGVPLCMGDGRDTRMDLLQELLDAIAYAEKYFRESGAGVNIFAKALTSMMDGLLYMTDKDVP